MTEQGTILLAGQVIGFGSLLAKLYLDRRENERGREEQKAATAEIHVLVNSNMTKLQSELAQARADLAQMQDLVVTLAKDAPHPDRVQVVEGATVALLKDPEKVETSPAAPAPAEVVPPEAPPRETTP